MKNITKLYILLFLTVSTLHTSAQNGFKKYYNLFNDTISDDIALAAVYLSKQKVFAKSRTEITDYFLNEYLLKSKQNNLSDALKSLDSAMLYVDDKDELRLFEVNNFKALSLFKLNEFDASYSLADSLLKMNLFDSIPYQVRMISNMGNALIAKQFYKEAVTLHKSYIESNVIDSIKYPSELHTLYQNLGSGYYYLSNFDSAIHWYIKSTALSISKVKRGRVFGSIAQIYTARRNADQAIFYYKKSINCSLGTPDYIGLIHNYYNIGDIYQLKSIDSAYTYYKKAYDLSNQYDYTLIKAYSSQGLGNVCMEKNNFDQAILYNKESINLFKTIDNTQGIVHAQMNLGKAYSRLGDFKKALFYGRSSIAGASKLEGIDVKALAYEHLYDVFYQKKEFDSAIHYYHKFHLLNDSIRSVTVEKNIDDLQIKYETELKEKENLQLKYEIEKAEVKKQFWFFTLILFAIVFALVILVLVFKNRTKKQKLKIQKQEIEQERIHKELAMANLVKATNLIQEKNNIIRSLEDESKNIDVAAAAESLITKINTNKEWFEFMTEFEMIYKGFFNKFQNNAVTQLTQNDNRLAALMKLNLSNKEMADILYISYGSVKKAKQRLTKKINLQENQKMIDLILSL